MGCLACLALRNPAKVVPCDWSSSAVQVDGIFCKPPATNRLGYQTRELANCLDSTLGHLLEAAGLFDPNRKQIHQPSSVVVTAAHVPKNVASLQAQLLQACRQQQPGNTRPYAVAISELAGCLLNHKQQQRQWHASGDKDDCLVPSAVALVNILELLLHSQVTLDTAAVLHERYQQSCDVLSSIGMHVSCLAACVQPANKATLACLQLGGKAPTGESRVDLVVWRQSAFWDALHQLQEQHIVPSDTDKQGPGSLQLAKLFPQFVDEHLSANHQQRLEPSQNVSSSAAGCSSFRECGLVVEGGEGHGPRKEFFELVAQNWTKAAASQPALFQYIHESGSWWFNTTLRPNAQLKEAYWAVGWLLAQVLINRSTLGVQLAPLLFHRLLQPAAKEFVASLTMLRHHDAEAAQHLEAVLNMPQQQYEQLLCVEGRPVGLARQKYVDYAVQQLLVHDVDWQYQAVRCGFYAVMNQQVLLDCCFDGDSLAAAICGHVADEETDFDIRQYYRVLVEGDGGCLDDIHTAASPSCMKVTSPGSMNSCRGRRVTAVSASDVTVHCLWLVVDRWSPQQKRALIKFITGSNSLPAKGSEQLTITFPFVPYGPQQQHQMLGILPQSHTCANTLELPNYTEALIKTDPQLAEEWVSAAKDHANQQVPICSEEPLQGLSRLIIRCCAVLEDRLLVAITCCQSYGLDDA